MTRPRELTEEEYNKFFPKDTYIGDGCWVKPKVEMTADIWYNFDPSYIPLVYRFYNCGTNFLRVLAYDEKQDKWFELTNREKNSLIGQSLLWKLLLLLGDKSIIGSEYV